LLNIASEGLSEVDAHSIESLALCNLFLTFSSKTICGGCA